MRKEILTLLALIYLNGITSYGQSLQLPAFDSTVQLETPSISIPIYVPTKELKKSLEKLDLNCANSKTLFNRNMTYYLVSTKSDRGYKLIINPVIDPSYSEIKKAIGAMLTDRFIVYCFGELPANIVNEVKGKRHTPSVRKEKADADMRIFDKTIVLSDFSTYYDHSVIYKRRNVIDLFIQPCSNK